jgi:myosin heavy subunit
LAAGCNDIYGFEIFESNSFEQFSITFVNQRLQQILIDFTLKAEQEEYAREGIEWSVINYYNNAPCVELIDGRPGLFSILDNACQMSNSDKMFIDDIESQFKESLHLNTAGASFSISHYAGVVSYEGLSRHSTLVGRE